MTRASHYPLADAKAQAFASQFRGSPIQPNVVVLHTTEGTTWPTYSGGATAPHATTLPDITEKRLRWRQHFPFTMSARALRNEDGGVQTNTLNCVQVELIGTCDPKHKVSWDGKGTRLAGQDYIFWPEAPGWALEGLADLLAFLHTEWAVKIQAVAAPKWLPYPASYGSKSGQRLTPSQWTNFYGVCGHQHVPENSHGDPGNIDIELILLLTKNKVTPPKPKKTHKADRVFEIAERALEGRLSKSKKNQWQAIKDLAQDLSEEH